MPDKLSSIFASNPGYHPYIFAVVFIIVGICFALTPLILAQLWFFFFAPKKSGSIKNAIYECGLASEGDSWIQIRVQYYLYAIVFLIFDLETVFLLPFAVAFSQLPIGGVIAMFIFILLLAEGLVWAWSKKYLEWS